MVVLLSLGLFFCLLQIASCGRALSSGKTKRAFSFLEAACKDLGCQILHLLFLPLAWIPWKSEKNREIPIVLVHGYLYTRIVWLYHLFFLRRGRLGPLYTLNLGYPFSSIEEFVSVLEKKLEALQREKQYKTFHLVGHSMGGLVCVAAALRPSHRYSIAKVITIGSPMQGTKSARWALGICGRQMEEHSLFTQSLTEKMAFCESTQFFHVGSCEDHIVPLDSSLRSPHPKRAFCVSGVGHLSLLLSREVQKKIEEYLS
ncbi:MAG: alpha/beta hydrolase [Chlamydiota bacterium]